ncbi:MAG: hypothetical protein RL662_1115 [Bacteroidota bacterium]|jgi:hypothetical protein
MSLVSAQDNNSGTKIDENERKRLENQFKALKTFYINDEGLVVYKKQEDLSTQAANIDDRQLSSVRDTTILFSQEEIIDQTPIVKRAISLENEPISDEYSTETFAQPTEFVVVEEQTAVASIESDFSNNGTDYLYSPSTRADSTFNRTQSTGNPIFIKKSPSIPTIPVNDAPKKEVTTERVVATRAPEPKKEEPSLVKKQTQPEEPQLKEISVRKTSSKKSVFEKKPSQYKDMEEAALAVEALLDKLKKEQSQNSSSGSMSSRLSNGAKSTLRKQDKVSRSTTITTSTPFEDTSLPILDNTLEEDIVSTELSEEPTYYVNGKQVDRLTINKLRKKDIINREVRTRNTASGNPNGEVWYEVKE